ncbi:MAG: hypothetical protein J2P38_01035 [Candidatus Dormibacteraeota bacterium]|nr:hypothetical protein [Candidatus Dormibacteraeota bacterium]
MVIEKAAGAALAAAPLALLAGVASGHWLDGLAGAVGLAIGSTNALLTRRSLHGPVGFRAASMARLVLLSLLGIAAGLLIGLTTLPFVIGGIALAQLLLAAVAIREVVHASRPTELGKLPSAGTPR